MMDMTMNAKSLLIVFAALVFVFVKGVTGADPDPLTDFAAGLSIFTLRNIFKNGDVSVDSGGIRAATSVDNFPATQSQGLSMVRFEMVPCGANLPHTHPRATEILTLISGGPLQAGFVDTEGQAFVSILYPGDVTIFPRGMMHFELNVGKKDAHYVSVLNSQTPGTLPSAQALFKIPARTVATAFNFDLNAVKKVNGTINPFGTSLIKTPTSGCVPGRDITVNF